MDKKRVEMIGFGLMGTAMTKRLLEAGYTGHQQPCDPPPGVDYDTWVGPAELVPLRKNRFHGNWHCWYNFGTGDIGNDGTHDIGYARRGPEVEGLPVTATATALGGKYYSAIMKRERVAFPVRWLAIAVLLLSHAIVVWAAEDATEVTFQQKPGKVQVTIGGQDVATYVYADPQIPRPYFAHVHGTGGLQLTRNHPPIESQDRTDHATMHPGIWMAFGDLNGTDIWRNKGRVVHRRFVQEPVSGSNRVSFAVRNRYETDAGRPICLEECRFTFLVRPVGYLLLWDSTFWSDSEFYFGDQEEMGLGVRLATPIAVTSEQGGRILDGEGRKNGQGIWGKKAAWCDYSGSIDGKFAGITIMPHPDNFRPCWWHARDYGFMAANPFGRAAFSAGPPSKVVVRPDTDLRLRFGILIHVGTGKDDVDLPAAYQDYLGMCRAKRGQQ
jgi:hypothetical protein